MDSRKPLQLLALNHVSRVCSDLSASYRFYTEILGFIPVKRPSSFKFEGAWLHNYGIGLHLIKGCPPPRPKTINPKSCHISFQAASLKEVEDSLIRQSIPFVKNVFMEDGVQVRQLFFHDPDDNMIEICNCDVLPVVPLKDATEEQLTAAVAAAAVAVKVADWPAQPVVDAAEAVSTPAEAEAMPMSYPISAASTRSDAGSEGTDTDTTSLHTVYDALSLLSEECIVPRAAETCDAAGRHDCSDCNDCNSGSFSSSCAVSGISLSDAFLGNSCTSSATSAVSPELELEEWGRPRLMVSGGVRLGVNASNGCGGNAAGDDPSDSSSDGDPRKRTPFAPPLCLFPFHSGVVQLQQHQQQ